MLEKTTSQLRRIGRWVRRHKVLTSVGVVLLGAATAAAWLSFWSDDEPPPLPAGVEPLTVARGPTEHPEPKEPKREPERPEPRPQEREVSDEPRTELEPGQVADGPSIARVKIPSIGVNAPVIRLGLNRDGTLQVPASADKTGWWTGGAFPGEAGPAVIAGHVDSVAGPSVFYRLRELGGGDKVTVEDTDGSRARFVVTGSEQHPKNDFPTNEVYGETDEATLRLVTCGGPFNEQSGHYRDNVIVFAREA